MIETAENKKRIIITAGGTKEAIDDVRFITNFSTGRFGHAIARAAMYRNFAVTLIAPREVPLLDGGHIPGVNYLPFTDTESLKNLLLSQDQADIVFHAAAVSDYRPKNRTNGKISSNKDNLTIELERTPKILPLLRDHFGNDTYIVGFKLLSGVTGEHLVEVAKQQTINARLNLTVANDLTKINDKEHPIHLVTTKGQEDRILGEKSWVAQKLLNYVNIQLYQRDVWRQFVRDLTEMIRHV